MGKFLTLSRFARLTAASGAAVLAAGLLPATTAGAAAAPTVTTSAISYLGSANMPAGSNGGARTSAPGQEIGPALVKDIAHPASPRRVALGAPAGSPILDSRGGSGGVQAGFDGINHYQQRSAGTGAYTNTQFSLEPPDQGLCVGSGYVLEAVNTALRVYDTAGRPLTGVVAINQFFGLTPAINRTTGVRGAFTSDPKCYYDAPTGHWFVTILEMGQSGGGFAPPSHTYIAVSETANPTGRWGFFSIDTTDDGSNGTPTHAGCPCFGDQPLLGADQHGLYVSTNEFSIAGPAFNGAQVYAMSKIWLERNPSRVTVVHIDAGTIPSPDPGGLWYSLQPATTPPGGRYARNTEYFLSSLDFFGAGDNRIAAWSLTGTSTLMGRHPHVALSDTVLSTPTSYFAPLAFGATQKNSSDRPLGNSLQQPEELLNANDDRMNQVVFDGHHLWGAVNTMLASGQVGIAYWQVDPQGPAVSHSGYVSGGSQNVLFPSIAANSSGQAVMAFSLSGPAYFPSAAYARWSPGSGGFGDIHVAGLGVLPEDGFSGYAPYGGNGIARWGDYSAAVADQSGQIWTASEYIPNDPRTSLANWGTFVAQVGAGGGN